jgi:hypothetical protein
MAEESKLQTRILNDLRSYGYHVFCTKIMKCTDNGVPDILFSSMKHGPGMIEVKASDGTLSKAQLDMIPKIIKAGMRAYVVSSWEQWLTLRMTIIDS